jgi:hypothetical protein
MPRGSSLLYQRLVDQPARGFLPGGLRAGLILDPGSRAPSSIASSDKTRDVLAGGTERCLRFTFAAAAPAARMISSKDRFVIFDTLPALGEAYLDTDPERKTR